MRQTRRCQMSWRCLQKSNLSLMIAEAARAADRHSGAKRFGVASLGQLCSESLLVSQRCQLEIDCGAPSVGRSVGRDPRGCTARSRTDRDPLVAPHVHPQIGRKGVDVSVHTDNRYRPLTRHRRMDAAVSLSFVGKMLWALLLMSIPPAREGFPRSRWWWWWWCRASRGMSGSWRTEEAQIVNRQLAVAQDWNSPQSRLSTTCFSGSRRPRRKLRERGIGTHPPMAATSNW